MARKIRSDSVLDSMPLHQQDALIEWLMEERVAPDKAVERLWEDFGVKSSETAIGTFWHRHCAPRLLRRSADAAIAFPEEAGGLGIDWTTTSRALVQQKYFELLSSPNPNPKLLTSFAVQIADMARGDLEAKKLEFNRQKHEETQSLRERDLALQREKFETTAAATALKFVAELKTIQSNRTMTEPARIEAARRTLFGVDPTLKPAEGQP